ncbi:ABC transporter permease [Rhizobium sp. BR 314]|uniref:ABC transporter permease n=1 Tax=Rhizobium sp. BR 314 TaxID=3040013 RepID=UPI0039BF3F51
MYGGRNGASLQIILEVVSDLRSLKSRAILALVGITIGTAAVIAMLHVGHNAKSEALRQFEALGADLISVSVSVGRSGQALSVDTVNALPEAGLGVGVTSAIVQNSAQVRVGQMSRSVRVFSATDSIYGLTKAQIQKGRLTSDLDGFSPYAVVGAGVAASVEAAAGKGLEIGETITVSDQVLTVVGILAPAEPNAVLGIGLDDALITPFLAARRLTGSPTISTIAARLATNADDARTALALKTYLERQTGEGTVNIQTARQIIRSIETQMRIYAILLLAIGTISLVVGGVGVMNVMLMSVLERRQEIGLRQALGARRGDIKLMFLTEAFALSSVGSVIGIAIGYAAGWVFAAASGWQFQPAPAAVPLGLGMAIAVGLFFGMYPAAKAARLEPVVALRSE